MIYGVGIDLIEVERVGLKIKKEDFLSKVYTPAEIRLCENNGNTLQSYAARFAAKEAFFKALGTGWIGFFSFNEVEILNDESGKPTISLYGQVKDHAQKEGLERITLSLTHLKEVAGAVVIIEK